MSKYEEAISFERYGFRIVKNVISPDLIAQIRAILDDVYLDTTNKKYFKTSSSSGFLHGDAFFNNSELSFIYNKIMFNDKVVNKLRETLGKQLAYFVGINLQKNSFGGWHIDSGSEYTSDYLTKDNYKFAKCALVLQDNSTSYGGSIDVVPNSHWHSYHKIKALKSLKSRILKPLYQILNFFQMRYFYLTVPAKAFFDSRLLHQATKPKKNQKLDDLPKQHTKYVFYWDACNSEMVGDFIINSQKRAILEGKGDLYFTEYLSRHYPTDYPQEFVNCAKVGKITIASLDLFRAKIFKSILDEYTK